MKESIYDEMMNVLRRRSKEEYEHINPNFLIAIEDTLFDYRELEDDDVHEWIVGMFGA